MTMVAGRDQILSYAISRLSTHRPTGGYTLSCANVRGNQCSNSSRSPSLKKSQYWNTRGRFEHKNDVRGGQGPNSSSKWAMEIRARREKAAGWAESISAAGSPGQSEISNLSQIDVWAKNLVNNTCETIDQPLQVMVSYGIASYGNSLYLISTW